MEARSASELPHDHPHSHTCSCRLVSNSGPYSNASGFCNTSWSKQSRNAVNTGDCSSLPPLLPSIEKKWAGVLGHRLLKGHIFSSFSVCCSCKVTVRRMGPSARAYLNTQTKWAKSKKIIKQLFFKYSTFWQICVQLGTIPAQSGLVSLLCFCNKNPNKWLQAKSTGQSCPSHPNNAQRRQCLL